MFKKIIIFILLMLIIPIIYAAEEKDLIQEYRTSKTTCNGKTCTLEIGRHEVKYNGRWIFPEQAPTLKGNSGITIDVKSDGVHFIKVLDYNLTAVKLNLTLNKQLINDCKLSVSKDCDFAKSVDTKSVPVKIELENKSFVTWSNADLSIKDNEVGIVKLQPNQVLHIGEESTLISFSNITTNGGSVSDNSGCTGSGVALFRRVWGSADPQLGTSSYGAGIMNKGFIEFDTSPIPDGASIDSAVLSLYLLSESVESGEGGIMVYSCDYGSSFDNTDFENTVLDKSFGEIITEDNLNQKWYSLALNDTTHISFDSKTRMCLRADFSCHDENDYFELEGTEASLKPVFNITYSVGGGEDLTAPAFNPTPINKTIHYHNDSYYQDINANEAVDTWTINDTIRFKISGAGVIENNTKLGVGTYYINLTINDSSNNKNFSNIRVTINKGRPTPQLSITPSSPETYPSTTTASGSYCNPETSCQLYLNGSIVPNNLSINVFGVGHYGYNYIAKSNINFTQWSNNDTLIINANSTDHYNIILNHTSGAVEPIHLKIGTDIKTQFSLFLNDTQISNNTNHILNAGHFNITALRNDTINYTFIRNESLFIVNSPPPDPCDYKGGNFNLNITCSYYDTTLNINGNLTILEGGFLNLTNTILNFNSTYQFIRFYGVSNMDKIRFNGTSGIN